MAHTLHSYAKEHGLRGLAQKLLDSRMKHFGLSLADLPDTAELANTLDEMEVILAPVLRNIDPDKEKLKEAIEGYCSEENIEKLILG